MPHLWALITAEALVSFSLYPPPHCVTWGLLGTLQDLWLINLILLSFRIVLLGCDITTAKADPETRLALVVMVEGVHGIPYE